MMTETAIAGLEALGRLVAIAQRDTGQSRRVANFLLAWYNAEESLRRSLPLGRIQATRRMV